MLPNMKESVGFVWLTVRWVIQPSYMLPDWVSQFNKMFCEILLRLRLCCIAWQIKLEGRRWNWLGSPPRTTLNQSNHTGYYPISSGGAESTLSHTLRGGQGSNNYVQTRTIWISRFFRVVDSVLSLITVMHFRLWAGISYQSTDWTCPVVGELYGQTDGRGDWAVICLQNTNTTTSTAVFHTRLSIAIRNISDWMNADWWSLIVLLDPL